jgi:hypothetical protein
MAFRPCRSTLMRSRDEVSIPSLLTTNHPRVSVSDNRRHRAYPALTLNPVLARIEALELLDLGLNPAGAKDGGGLKMSTYRAAMLTT